MTPEIKFTPQRKLIGMKLTMSFANNQTAKLWQSFMPCRKEITNPVSADLISLQVYPADFDFSSHKEFTKWAAIEVSDFNNVPESMETFEMPAGQYAVFHYKGSGTDTRIFQYIFQEWLPQSNYQLDNRPHFEVLGEKYKNACPDSEEEIWIPVKPR